MAGEPIIRALDVPQVQVGHSIWSGALFEYWMLTKPEINFLIANCGRFLSGLRRVNRAFPMDTTCRHGARDGSGCERR
jgi:hypothetical protein